MDWVGWAVFGSVATGGLTPAMIFAQLAGKTRLDLPGNNGPAGRLDRLLELSLIDSPAAVPGRMERDQRARPGQATGVRG